MDVSSRNCDQTCKLLQHPVLARRQNYDRRASKTCIDGATEEMWQLNDKAQAIETPLI